MMKVVVRVATDTENPGFVVSLRRRPKNGELLFDPKGRGATLDEAKKALLCQLYDAGYIKVPEAQPMKKRAKKEEPPPIVA